EPAERRRTEEREHPPVSHTLRQRAADGSPQHGAEVRRCREQAHRGAGQPRRHALDGERVAHGDERPVARAADDPREHEDARARPRHRPGAPPAAEVAGGTGTARVNENERRAKPAAVRKKALNPARAMTTSPSDGPRPLVSMPAAPKTAMPSARRPGGTRSAAYVK